MLRKQDHTFYPKKYFDFVMFWLKKNPRKSTFCHFYSFIFVNSSALGVPCGRSLFFQIALRDKKIHLDSQKYIQSPKYLKDLSSFRLFFYSHSLSLKNCINLFSLLYSKQIRFENLIQYSFALKAPQETESQPVGAVVRLLYLALAGRVCPGQMPWSFMFA